MRGCPPLLHTPGCPPLAPTSGGCPPLAPTLGAVLPWHPHVGLPSAGHCLVFLGIKAENPHFYPENPQLSLARIGHCKGKGIAKVDRQPGFVGQGSVAIVEGSSGLGAVSSGWVGHGETNSHMAGRGFTRIEVSLRLHIRQLLSLDITISLLGKYVLSLDKASC